MRCAIYSAKMFNDIPDYELFLILKKIKRLNLEYNITGCLVHYGDEFLQIVQGNFTDIYNLYTVRGLDKRIFYGTPIFSDDGFPYTFEFFYIVSEALYFKPGAAEIPIFNYKDLNYLKGVLGSHTLGLSFFWKSVEEALKKGW